MTKLITVFICVAALLGIAGLVIYNTAAGQDALFKRAAKAVMSQRPQVLDGMRVIVCGSASPLGTDPERAQACIAVLTPEHFFSG